MAFTQDELQAFHIILDQRLSAHRREVERGLDQRMNVLRREFEQRLVMVQQEIARALTHQLSEQQIKLSNSLSYKFEAQQSRSVQVIEQEVRQRQQQQQQHFESFVKDALAAQLLAMEQLLRQNLVSPFVDEHGQPMYGNEQPDFETFEVQTEIPWEDLVEMVGKALDERMTTLDDATQNAIRNMEQHLSARLLNIRDELLLHAQPQPYNGTITNMQDVFTSIQQLERIIESMQVAMTANHALLSNRLQRHQQLPLERAHLAGQPAQEVSSHNKKGLLSRSQEREYKKEQ